MIYLKLIGVLLVLVMGIIIYFKAVDSILTYKELKAERIKYDDWLYGVDEEQVVESVNVTGSY